MSYKQKNSDKNQNQNQYNFNLILSKLYDIIMYMRSLYFHLISPVCHSSENIVADKQIVKHDAIHTKLQNNGTPTLFRSNQHTMSVDAVVVIAVHTLNSVNFKSKFLHAYWKELRYRFFCFFIFFFIVKGGILENYMIYLYCKADYGTWRHFCTVYAAAFATWHDAVTSR